MLRDVRCLTPRRWKDPTNVWVHAYWAWDWANSYERVVSLDLETRLVRTAPPYGNYGFRKGQRFCFLNVLEELDQPGEWFLDRTAGILYFWPPGGPDTLGRDYTCRGNRIRHNFIHHTGGVGMGSMGVYMDDCVSGTEIFGNIFFKVQRAAFLGGGRDHQVINNIFVDCNPAVELDGRGLNPSPVWRGNEAEPFLIVGTMADG